MNSQQSYSNLPSYLWLSAILALCPTFWGTIILVEWMIQSVIPDWSQIWIQVLKSLFPYFSTHQTFLSKVKIAFAVPWTDLDSSACLQLQLASRLGNYNSHLIFSLTPQLITCCCLARTLSLYNMNLSNEHLWVTSLKCQAPSLCLTLVQGEEPLSFVGVWLSSAGSQGTLHPEHSPDCLWMATLIGWPYQICLAASAIVGMP